MLESLNYSYDATGNRISMNRQSVTLPLRNDVTNTNYNEANQMLKYNASSDNIGYDENGNMTSVINSCGTTNYTWDVRNRLSSISGFKPDCSSLTASFKYDALGRRTEKSINGVTTQYLYDGLDIVQEIENGAVSANYIRTLNIDEPLARIKADGTVRYYQTDALGSVIALTDDIGVVKTQYAYDSFGAVTVSGEASDNPFQYTGRENDNTGLYYYRARYYSPELQRFVSEDPIELDGGINFFVYTQNNPVNLIDFDGLDAKCATFRIPWGRTGYTETRLGNLVRTNKFYVYQVMTDPLTGRKALYLCEGTAYWYEWEERQITWQVVLRITICVCPPSYSSTTEIEDVKYGEWHKRPGILEYKDVIEWGRCKKVRKM